MSDTKISLKYYFICFFVALLFNYFYFTKIFIYITSMYVHELGHAFFAWMSGRIAVPIVGMTFIGGKSYFFIFFSMAMVIGFLIYKAWQDELKFMLFSLIATGILTVYVYSRSEPQTLALISWGGMGAEIIVPGWLILACSQKLFKIVYWDFFKVFVLPIALIWFVNSTGFWLKAEKNIAMIPYGSGISSDGAQDKHGDMNRLVDGGWKPSKIATSYSRVSKLFIFMILLQLVLMVIESRSQSRFIGSEPEPGSRNDSSSA